MAWIGMDLSLELYLIIPERYFEIFKMNSIDLVNGAKFNALN